MITRENIEKNEPFLVKWGTTPKTTDDEYSAGIKLTGQSDEFLTRLEEETSILKDSRFIMMDTLEEDIEHLRVKAELQNMRKLAKTDGKQIPDLVNLNETTPIFYKSTITANPFTAYTYTPKTFLLENIEKQTFLSKYEATLIPACAYSSEIIGIYGKDVKNQSTSGLHAIDGLLAQLEGVKTAYKIEGNARGYFDSIDMSKDIIPQLMEMIFAFTIQHGKIDKAKFKVSSVMKGRIFKEASQRQTQKGDEIFFDGKEMRIFNIPVEAAHVLEEPVNGYGEHVILANFDSFAFGYLNNMESENTYEHSRKAYLTSVDVYFGTAIIYGEDILAAPVINGEIKSVPPKDNSKKAKEEDDKKISENVGGKT